MRLLALWHRFRQYWRSLFFDTYWDDICHLDRCYRRPAVPGAAKRRAQP